MVSEENGSEGEALARSAERYLGTGLALVSVSTAGYFGDVLAGSLVVGAGFLVYGSVLAWVVLRPVESEREESE